MLKNVEMKKKYLQAILDAGIVSIIAFGIICIVMRAWEMDFNLPAATSGDGMLGYMLQKNIMENGIFGNWFNYSIGAPEMSALIDTPFLDIPMVLEYWIVGAFSPSVFAAYYMVYFLSYPLAALTMLFLLRNLKTNRFVAIIISILYAITPYHFIRGMGHGTLSNYYCLPLGIFLAVLVLKEEYKGGIPKRFRTSKLKCIGYFFTILLVGLSNVYYSFFSMLLILIAVICKGIQKKNIKVLLNEFRVFIYMAISFLLGIAPKIIYSIKSGANVVAGVRLPLEADIYALKLIQMLLPPSYSRIGLLRKISDAYNTNGFNINENGMACMGFVAAIGFAIACVWFFVKYAGKRKATTEKDKIIDFMVLGIIVILLWSTAGGFGTIFSYVITPEIRALNRSSIVIVTLCLGIVALCLEYIIKKVKFRWLAIGLCITLGVALYAETPVTAENWQEGVKIIHGSYTEFFAKVEDNMEEGAMIYQLPFMNFPEESPIYNMSEYAHFKAYVYTDTLKWSYGGIQGRNTKAAELNIDNGMSREFVEGIIESGFDGVYIDADGFEDGGVQINEFYQKEMGLEPIISSDGKLFFYSLNELK